MSGPDLSVKLAGLSLKNPVMPASGCFGFGQEYAKYYPLHQLGAVVTKAVTRQPRQGNPTPRVTEVKGGMLNAIGLANPGVEHVLANELPWLAEQDVPVVVNVAGETAAEYVEVAELVSKSGLAAAIELNVSCPNVKAGGITFGVDPQILESLVKEVRSVCSIPLFVKLSPNVADIREIALAAQSGGADGLTLINTLIGMKIDIKSRRPVLANRTGGLSGPAVKPVAVRMVYDTAQVVDIPIIGMGGICTGADAVEFIMAGASAVMVGTANFTNPRACPKIIAEIREFMEANGIESLDEIRGCAL
ncbi:MAG: dihydroorotate dehydrogenase [Candidatus Wallacebacter cryptica]|jgi:dihydroorotate dehydrogenase (NAD+) catalytic subunit|nr:dihydroorotate dehydrogenase [Bacillota bacterium]